MKAKLLILLSIVFLGAIPARAQWTTQSITLKPGWNPVTGLVTLASPIDALPVNASALTSVMVRPAEGPKGLAAVLSDQRKNAVALGQMLQHQPGVDEVEGAGFQGVAHDVLHAHLDHRIVMAFAALGTRIADGVTFDDVSSVATSYPAYFETLAALGADVQEVA